MFNFYGMTGFELGVIKGDFKSLLKSPEAHIATVEYQTVVSAGVESIDPVYKYNTAVTETRQLSVTYPCVHKLTEEVGAEDFSFRFSSEGSSLFFFGDTIDFTKPDGENEAIKDSIVLVDGSGRRWQIDSNDTSKLNSLYGIMLGQQGYATVVVCNLFREDK